MSSAYIIRMPQTCRKGLAYQTLGSVHSNSKVNIRLRILFVTSKCIRHRIKYDDMSRWIGLNIALLIVRYYWFVWKARGHRNIVRRTMISKIPHENQPKLANDELKENLINACTGTYNCEKVCASDFWCVRLREKVRKCFLAGMRERRCAQVFTGAYARPNVCESVYTVLGSKVIKGSLLVWDQIPSKCFQKQHRMVTWLTWYTVWIRL